LAQLQHLLLPSLIVISSQVRVSMPLPLLSCCFSGLGPEGLRQILKKRQEEKRRQHDWGGRPDKPNGDVRTAFCCHVPCGSLWRSPIPPGTRDGEGGHTPPPDT
jgi:hypothetical protein